MILGKQPLGWPGLGWMGRGRGQWTEYLPHVRAIHNLGSTSQARGIADSGCESLGGLPRVPPSPGISPYVHSPASFVSVSRGVHMVGSFFSRQRLGSLHWDMFPGSPLWFMTSSELKCPFLDLWILRFPLAQAPQGYVCVRVSVSPVLVNI